VPDAIALTEGKPEADKRKKKKMYGNELKITLSMDDGRVFDVERGKIDADIGYESHGMFVLKMKYDWGIYTYGSLQMESCVNYNVGSNDRVYEPKPYAHNLIKAMLEVCNVDYFGSIKNHEMYILFNRRNHPAGLANIKDIQKSLIFEDITSATS
jgi:hypothetical protein